MRRFVFIMSELTGLRLLSVSLFLIISVGLFSGCTEKKSDEVMIQEQIKVLQDAIETHDRRKFMAVIDSQYYDRLNSDPKSLQRMLIGFFLRYKDISVYVSESSIEIMHVRAEVKSQIVLTGGKGLLPERARHYQVSSCWKKVSDEWLLSCLEWE